MVACTPFVRAQTDTLFWFVAPEVSVAFSNFDVPIVLRITTYSDAATVTVSQPAGGGMPTQTVAIAAASNASYERCTIDDHATS